jgi:hypothetical protein
MRTRDAPDAVTQLPPPPAPTARDANPWRLPELDRQPRRAPNPRRPLRRAARAAQDRPRRRVLQTVLPLAFFALILAVALREAARSGDFQEMVGVALPLLLLAVFVVTRLRASRRRSSRETQGADEA